MARPMDLEAENYRVWQVGGHSNTQTMERALKAATNHGLRELFSALHIHCLILTSVRSADASSHLFFGYLRSLNPEALDGFTGINGLPRSIQALLAQTEYPPEAPVLMQKQTPKVVMLVDVVSPGPFALLRRANNFEYRDEDLQMFSEYADPVQALTEECRRVLHCITSANQSIAVRSQSNMSLGLESLNSRTDAVSYTHLTLPTIYSV